MKKVLLILSMLAITCIASAAMVNNPEDLEGAALGEVAQGVPIEGWESWGEGEGDMGYSHSWWAGDDDGSQPGLVIAAEVIDTGGNQALIAQTNPNHNWWGYGLAFAHGNEIAALPAGSAAPGTVELNFDLLFGGSGAIVKIEYWGDLDRTIALGADVWDPIDLSAGGAFTFTGNIPAGAMYVTPVLGTTGAGSFAVYDNISLTAVVPEPATLTLLGLGALVLRRKK